MLNFMPIKDMNYQPAGIFDLKRGRLEVVHHLSYLIFDMDDGGLLKIPLPRGTAIVVDDENIAV